MTRAFGVLCSFGAGYMAWIGDWFGVGVCGVAACLNVLNWIDDARHKAIDDEKKR